jgi:hypothetical protein
MNRRIFATIALSWMLFLGPTRAGAQVTASFQDVSGKVEYRAAGNGWQAASVGDEIGPGAVISTGFGAEAALLIGESILTVDALTRLELEELIRREGVVDSDVYLSVGRVRADVRDTEGVSPAVRLRSPQVVASVRGTDFVFDGKTLAVEEGTVLLTNRVGEDRAVTAGQTSFATGLSLPLRVDLAILSRLEVDPYLARGGEESIATREEPTATVTISISAFN